MTGRCTRLIVAAAVFALAVYACIALGGSAQLLSRSHDTATATEATSLSSQMAQHKLGADEVMRRYVDRADAGWPSPVRTAEAPRTSSATDPCTWDTHFIRDVDLVDSFLMGSVKVEHIARNRVLNFGDRALCPDEIEELRLVLDEFNRRVGPVLSAFRDLRTSETCALVDGGQLEEWPSTPASDEDVRRYEQLLIRGGVGSLEARRNAEASRASLGSRPAGNYMRRDGKYYSMPQAADLPLSTAYFANVRFVVLDQLQIVIAWFAQKGLVVDTNAVTQLREAIEARRTE